jgi:hypothetical protein
LDYYERLVYIVKRNNTFKIESAVNWSMLPIDTRLELLQNCILALSKYHKETLYEKILMSDDLE